MEAAKAPPPAPRVMSLEELMKAATAAKPTAETTP
jgi:hypothetical protein